MPPNMEWKCYSLVFLFGYKLSIFTMFSLKNVTKQSGFCQNQVCCLQNRIYMLPIIAYVKGYDIENQINTSQSINYLFQAT